MRKLILLPVILITLFLALSCSTNDNDDIFNEPVASQNSQNEILQKEINALRNSVNPNSTYGGAYNNGYNTPFLGTHTPTFSYYVNEELVDEKFKINNPEVIIFQKDSKGNNSFAGVAYLLPLDSLKNSDFDLPSGFHGSDDQWTNDKNNNVMILYVWLGYFNDNGLFSPQLPTDENIPGKDIIFAPN